MKFDLTRFIEAQSNVYTEALAELRRGKKQTHWMWFIFPQLAGLGHSSTAKRYAIRDRAEAAAYLAHPVLSERLRECAAALLLHHRTPIREILGSPDDVKLRSSMTLFLHAYANGISADVFREVLEKFYRGEEDPATLRILGETSPQP